MFCSQCGKKVNDTMLFCPFCGAALVLPEQDDAKPAAPETKSAPANAGVSQNESAPEIEDVPKEAFEPLDLDAFAVNESHESPFRRPRAEPEDAPSMREPVHLEGNVPDLSSVRAPVRPKSKAAKRRPSTYVPQKAFNPDDIFLDGDDDDFDEPNTEEEFSFEEPLEGGFFERHIRGMVGLMAFAILLIVLLLWSLSASGQRTLASVNLAWRADAYEQIAYEAYQNQNYTLSAAYYLKALAREPDSYTYAYSAGVMYLWNSDPANAAEMAKRAIQIDPTRSDAYKLLVQAYPDVSTRPWEIQSLVEQGYKNTGLEELKPNT